MTAAAGILLQKLPGPRRRARRSEARLQDLWEEARLLLATVKPEELLATEPEELLAKLFAGHDLRLFEGDAVRFACRCGRERVATMLQSHGARGNRLDHRRAGRGHGDLRVLPASLSFSTQWMRRSLFVALAVDPPGSVN